MAFEGFDHTGAHLAGGAGDEDSHEGQSVRAQSRPTVNPRPFPAALPGDSAAPAARLSSGGRAGRTGWWWSSAGRWWSAGPWWWARWWRSRPAGHGRGGAGHGQADEVGADDHLHRLGRGGVGHQLGVGQVGEQRLGRRELVGGVVDLRHRDRRRGAALDPGIEALLAERLDDAGAEVAARPVDHVDRHLRRGRQRLGGGGAERVERGEHRVGVGGGDHAVGVVGVGHHRQRDHLQRGGVVHVDGAERLDQLVDLGAAQGLVGGHELEHVVGEVEREERVTEALRDGQTREPSDEALLAGDALEVGPAVVGPPVVAVLVDDVAVGIGDLEVAGPHVARARRHR